MSQRWQTPLTHGIESYANLAYIYSDSARVGTWFILHSFESFVAEASVIIKTLSVKASLRASNLILFLRLILILLLILNLIPIPILLLILISSRYESFHFTTVSAADTDAARKELLAAIAAKKGDDGVIKALRELQKANPTPKPAKTDLLYGKWKLLWASDNSEVSIATRK